MNIRLTRKCEVCSQKDVVLLFDVGEQVVCHHFLKSVAEQEEVYHLTLGQCQKCGTVQLIDRIPVDKLRPRYDWLKCNEPEAHLDNLVTTMTRLSGITKDSMIGGISFKDDTTLERFNRLGFKNTWRADTVDEFGISNPLAGFESVQAHFGPETVGRLIQNHGKADVFIARHIIEHSYNLNEFITLAKELINPGGYIFFEIPDCQRAMESLDYTTIWEEHLTYFTEATFRYCFGFKGLSLVHFERIPYSIEDSYVGIAQIDKKGLSSHVLPEDELNRELLRGKNFAAQYQTKKNEIKGFFAKFRQQGKKTALFGGGHMSCVFLNIFDLKEDIQFIVDDNPNMRGLFMPGSRLPILESKAIYEQDIDICILTLSASSEDKVIKNNQRFIEKGGAFFSVFPGSQWAMGA